jgi:hypothetical protein
MEFGMQRVEDRAHFGFWKSWVNWSGVRFAVMHLNAREIWLGFQTVFCVQSRNDLYFRHLVKEKRFPTYYQLIHKSLDAMPTYFFRGFVKLRSHEECRYIH